MLYVLSVIWLVSTILSSCPGHSTYCSNHFVPKYHGKCAITHGIQFSAGNDQGYPTTFFLENIFSEKHMPRINFPFPEDSKILDDPSLHEQFSKLI